ncbi:U3 snoRNP protein, partial [Coemansia sp. RSA 25]
FDAQIRAIGEAEAKRIQPFAALQGLLALSTIVRKGASVGDYKPLFQRCRQSFELAQTLQSDARLQGLLDEENGVAEILAHERIKWLSGLLVQCNVAELVTVGKLLLDLALTVEPTHSILSMALTLARIEWSQWGQIMLPYVVRLTVARWAEARVGLLLFWAELFQLDLLKALNGTASSVITERGLVLFPTSAAKEAKASKRRSTKQDAAPGVSRALVDWLAEPVAWAEVAEQRLTIPSTDRVEFSGFGETEDSESESAESPAPPQPSSSIPELAIKSAVLTMLAHVSIDATMLMDSLHSFIEQLVSAISSVSARLAEDNAYLQHVAASPAGRSSMGPSDAELWGDEASEALGLHAAKSDRLYWGRYYQLHPMVGLLGRALKLQATTALRAASPQATEELMDAWTLALDSVLPVHYGNPALIEGLHKTAEALQQLSAASSQSDAELGVKQRLATALSLSQLEPLMPLLEHNLMSFQPKLRLQTLKFLALFEQPLMRSSKQGGSSEESCDIIQLGIELETVPASLDTYKEKTNPLRRMAAYSSNGRVPKIYSRVFPYLAIMQLSVNFSLVWTETNKQLALLASANPSLLWAA